MSLDVLCLRRPKINYVSPPVCESIFSGSGIPIIVLEPFNLLVKITGIVVIRDGNTRVISWPAYPGAICYNIYQQQPDGSYLLIAECVEDTTITLPPGLPIRITPVTPDGEGDLSDPVDINGGGGGGGGCEDFIDDTQVSAIIAFHQASQVNGVVAGNKVVDGFQRPWKYLDRVSGDIRSTRSSGAVQASQSASDLVDSVSNFFEASDVGKFLKFTSGGDAREILAVNGPTQVQVDVVDTVALSTFTVYGKTFGGNSGQIIICNGAGQFAGFEDDVAGLPRAFWFDDGTGSYRDLGNGIEVLPTDLNENGFLLYLFNDGMSITSFVYNPITQTTTQVGISSYQGQAINDNLVVVGEYLFFDHFPAPAEFHAFKWVGGVSTDIHPAEAGSGPGKFSEGKFVNNSGLIIGQFVHDTLGNQRTFFNIGGASISIGAFVPGTSGNQGYVIAEDLSESGITVGGADIEGLTGSGISNGFKWTQAGGLIRLFPLSGHTFSIARSVNEAGYIVGDSQGISDPNTTACIWLPGQTVPENLNSFLPPGSGWVLFSATHITEDKEIIGFGSLNGNPKTFFMKVCSL